MLSNILDVHEDDTNKSGVIYLGIGAINNVFYAIRSLVHIGKAFSSAHEPSDSFYTADNSRSLMERYFKL